MKTFTNIAPISALVILTCTTNVVYAVAVQLSIHRIFQDSDTLVRSDKVCRDSCELACKYEVIANECWGEPRYVECRCNNGQRHEFAGCACENEKMCVNKPTFESNPASSFSTDPTPSTVDCTEAVVTTTLTLKVTETEWVTTKLSDDKVHESYDWDKQRAMGNENRSPVNLERDCVENFYSNQKLDHFNYLNQVEWSQRYFICTSSSNEMVAGSNNPILFYTGGEVDIELVSKETGLMWEASKQLGGLMVFAEHRYFGKSKPYTESFNPSHPHLAYLQYQFLSTEQALADYARLIDHIKQQFHAPRATVVSFGGFYSGMLSFWLRQKYPGSVDGAISNSAPLLGYINHDYMVQPDYNGFSRIVTQDATHANGGTTGNCTNNIWTGFQLIDEYSKSEKGRNKLNAIFGRCDDSLISMPADALELKKWLFDGFSYLAMASYPFASGFFLGGRGNGILPPYPMQTACSIIKQPFNDGSNTLQGMMIAVGGMYYNNKGDKKCLGKRSRTAFSSNEFDYLSCTELIMPMESSGKFDMFWSNSFNIRTAIDDCKNKFGARTDPKAAFIKYGGRKGIKATTNVIFTQGTMDPYASMGVLEDVNDKSTTIILPRAGRHQELFFSTPGEQVEVVNARAIIVQKIKQWIQENTDEYKNAEFLNSQKSIQMFAWNF